MTRHRIRMVDPKCAECGKMAREVTGAEIWPDRRDLHDKTMWLCECGAYCGSHPGTDAPLGYPAGPALRALRMRAHNAFDAIWSAKMRTAGWSKGRARNAAYAWLAGEMKMDVQDCHFAHMDEAAVRRAIEIVEPVRDKVQRAEQNMRSAGRAT